MSAELDLIRAFRAEDAVIDASSQENARAALLEHIASSTTSTPRKRRGWLRRPSRPMAVLLVALVIAGAGGAVVLSLNRSQPLAGRVPGVITPASLAGYGYTIAVLPQLAAGTTGWGSLIIYSRPDTSDLSQPGGGPPGYPTATRPVFGGGTGPDSCPVCYARGNPVTYVLTGPQVFAVRIGSRTIRTVTSRALPTGVRAAVVFIPAKGRVFFIPGGRVPVGKPPPGMKNVLLVAVAPLDRSGHVIATQFTPPPPAPQPLTWMAPDAVTRWWPLASLNIEVPYHQKGYPGRTHPGPGVCELAQHGLPALHAEFGHTIAAISPDPDALGEVFVSCLDAEYYLHGWPLQAGVLLDGHRPGQVLGPIPGARPVPGHPDMVNLPLGQVPWNYDGPITADSPQFSLTAKRVGNAWLVVQGGSGLAQRVQVLNALRISKLDVRHLTSGHAPHELVYLAEPSVQAPVVTRVALERTVDVMRKRLQALAIGGAHVSVSGANEITVVLPNVRNTAQAEREVGTTAQLAFYDWEANALTPNGKTVASQLQAHNPTATAVEISQGSGPMSPGSPGAGSMALYPAVQLASKQQGWSSSANSRTGPQYWMFGSPGSAGCAAAARDQGTVPVVGQHCLLSRPDDNLTDLRAGLPSGVSASGGQTLTVPRGWVVLQAIPADFSHPTPIGYLTPIGSASAQFYVLKDNIALRGSDITNPQQSTDPNTGTPAITFGFNSKGKTEFQNVTAAIARRGSLVSGLGQSLNQHFAVALDNQLITVPYIDHRQFPHGINGDAGGDISGSFTKTSAQDLANELRLGALPLNLKLKCEGAPATTPCHSPRVR